MTQSLNKSHKGKFPFRLATTSYIYPDTWAGNTERLAPFIDEIELVFFESTPESLPDDAEIQRLHSLSDDHGTTYNVHMPIDLKLGSGEPAERRHAIDTILRLSEMTGVLRPSTHTVHLDAVGRLNENITRRIWLDRLEEGLSEILSGGMKAKTITIENLDYPFAWVEPLIREMGLRVCFDVGHFYLNEGPQVMENIDRYRHLTDIIHLYGIEKSGQHGALDTMPEILSVPLIQHLKTFTGIVSMEVFSFENLAASLEHMEKLWNHSQR